MKKYLDYVLLGASALLGVLTLILMSAPGLTLPTAIGTGTSSVYKVMGEGSSNGGAVVGLIFALVFTIAALLVPACLCVLKAMGKKFKYGAFLAIVAALLAAVAALMFFLTKSMSGYSSIDAVKLGAGSVLCGIFMIINALALCFYGYAQLKK